jgi:circadian clock protein KaiC
MVQRFSRQGVSVMMTFEIPQLYSPDRLSHTAVSHLSDNVVILSYVREHDLTARSIAVIKTRATTHDPAGRRFTIGSAGIVLDEAASNSGAGIGEQADATLR